MGGRQNWEMFWYGKCLTHEFSDLKHKTQTEARLYFSWKANVLLETRGLLKYKLQFWAGILYNKKP